MDLGSVSARLLATREIAWLPLKESMCRDTFAAQGTPWGNGKADTEYPKGVKSHCATQGCALV